MKYPKPALALVILALLAGCSQGPDQTDKHSGLALANMDTRVKPGDDFFRYVNGHWLGTAKIPDDRPADGAFYLLRDKSLADVRVLVARRPSNSPISSGLRVSDAIRRDAKAHGWPPRSSSASITPRTLVPVHCEPVRPSVAGHAHRKMLRSLPIRTDVIEAPRPRRKPERGTHAVDEFSVRAPE